MIRFEAQGLEGTLSILFASSALPSEAGHLEQLHNRKVAVHGLYK